MIPAAGMTISVRTRQDVVVVDPDRFRAAAREAYRELNPEATEETVDQAVADVREAVFALLTPPPDQAQLRELPKKIR